MNLVRRTPQILHEDHQRTIEVIEALDRLLAQAKRKPADTSDAQTSKTLSLAASAISQEVSAHFTFEETELFPRLEEAGDQAIGAHLRAEHAAILPLGQQVADLSKQALETGFTASSWQSYRNAAAELVERMFAHIQKEEMALLPMLDDLLDAETDMALAERYAGTV